MTVTDDIEDRASELADITAELLTARDSTVPVPRRPWMRREHGAWVKRELIRQVVDGENRPVRGYKVSLTKAWGVLFDGDLLESGAEVPLSSLIDPLIETEAVFHLQEEITPDMTVADVMHRVRVSAGIEIADCRWEGWGPTERGFQFAPEIPGGEPRFPSKAMLDADNGFARYVVVGQEQVEGDALDWPSVRVDCRRNGEVIAGGELSHVFGHPAESVLILAKTLAGEGMHLEPGVVVSTGNPYSDLLTVPRGSRTTFECVIHGLGEAAVTFS